MQFICYCPCMFLFKKKKKKSCLFYSFHRFCEVSCVHSPDSGWKSVGVYWCCLCHIARSTPHTIAATLCLSSCVWFLTFWDLIRLKFVVNSSYSCGFFTIMLASHWCLDLGLDISAFPKNNVKFATNSPKQLQSFYSLERKQSNSKSPILISCP